MTVVGELVTKFTADTSGLKDGVAQYGKELSEAEKKNKDFNKGLDSITSAITEVTAGFVAGAAAVALFIKSATGFADSMKAASYATGLSTEELQRWRAAGLEADVPFDALTMTTRMMVSRMGEVADGGSEMSKALKDIGVSAYDANGNLKSTNDLTWDIINGLAKQPAGMERSSKALAILGRGWYNLAPMIEQAADAQKAYNEADVFGEDKINELHAYQTALDKAGGAMEKWAVIIGDKLTPLIDRVFMPVIDRLSQNIETLAWLWDTAQFKIASGYLLIEGKLKGNMDLYNAFITAQDPSRPKPTSPTKTGGTGNTYMPDLAAQKAAAEAAQKSLTKAAEDYVDTLEDINAEKRKMYEMDRDYFREMSIVGWDVAKARDLTIRHKWAEQDQMTNVKTSEQIKDYYGERLGKAAGNMMVGGNLVLNINAVGKTITQAFDESKELVKQRFQNMGESEIADREFQRKRILAGVIS